MPPVTTRLGAHHGRVAGSFQSHCPHCWGNCPGTCLIPGIGGCIHQGPKLSWRDRLRLARTRRFWGRVLFGTRYGYR